MDQAALAMQKALARSAKVESGFAPDRALSRYRGSK
jgi:hypothetical protein